MRRQRLAKAHGCAHTIVYTREDFVKRVDEITEGKKVPVVYDSVGKDTFLKSLDCLAPLGVAALFGQSSGGVERLTSACWRRRVRSTSPADAQHLRRQAREPCRHGEGAFRGRSAGAVKIEVNQTYPLKDAAKAHADLAARKNHGIDGSNSVRLRHSRRPRCSCGRSSVRRTACLHLARQCNSDRGKHQHCADYRKRVAEAITSA